MTQKKKNSSNIVKNDFVSRKDIVQLFLIYRHDSKDALLQRIIDMPGLKRRDFDINL